MCYITDFTALVEQTVIDVISKNKNSNLIFKIGNCNFYLDINNAIVEIITIQAVCNCDIKDLQFKKECKYITQELFNKKFFKTDTTAITNCLVKIMTKSKKLVECSQCGILQKDLINNLCNICIYENFVNDNDQKCSICLNSVCGDTGVTICGDTRHNLHRSCIKKMVKFQCPICRKKPQN